jgi:hypothetical protein
MSLNIRRRLFFLRFLMKSADRAVAHIIGPSNVGEAQQLVVHSGGACARERGLKCRFATAVEKFAGWPVAPNASQGYHPKQL